MSHSVDLVASQPGHPAPLADPALKPPAPAPALATVVHQTNAVLSPAEVYQVAVDAAVAKQGATLPKLALMGIASGLYIGLGFTTCALVGGNLSPEFRAAQPGAFAALYSLIGFPLGLVLIVFCGGDLFTGNCFYSTAALMEGKIGFLAAVRMLVASWWTNLVGCLLMLGLFDGAKVWPGRDHYLVHLAEAKCALGWGTAVVRGVLANLLVCLAVWLANAARDASGKILGIYLPIMSFTSIGLEHCIANMFIVPMGIVQGANVTVGQFIYKNLIPATIGNWIGGAFLVGVLSAGIHGSPGRRMSEAWLGAAERLRPAAARCCGAAGACCGGRRESIGNVEAHAQ